MRKYYTDLVDRAVRTFAQTAGALLAVDGLGLMEVDWTATASVSGLAALLSALTTIGQRGIFGKQEG